MGQCMHEIMRVSCMHCTPQRGGGNDDADTPGPVFNATFRGHCAGCLNIVDVGDELRMWDGFPYHTFCLPERFLREYG
jgi:hypothetical protein